ncbi:MAG: hypothetical protein ABRQ27_09755 [Clostridiaceae bacterium]
MNEHQLIKILNQFSINVMVVQRNVKVKLEDGTIREATSEEKLLYLMDKWYKTMVELENINISLKGRFLC